MAHHVLLNSTLEPLGVPGQTEKYIGLRRWSGRLEVNKGIWAGVFKVDLARGG